MINRRNLLSTFGVGVLANTLPASLFAAQSETNTKVILLGTQGGPNFNLQRGETASMLLVDNVPYLIDCGYGAKRAILAAGVNFLNLSTIFLTHLHDDHIGDLPGLLSNQWTQGRVEPTAVYGPYGTDAMVEAALQFTQGNRDIRFVDEKRTVEPSSLFSGEVIPATSTSHVAFEDERVRVSTIENTHFPDWAKEQMPYRALSYRFDTEDRSVVFSGDTTYSENLVTLAKDADVFVCECIQLEKTREWFDSMTSGGEDDLYNDAREGIWEHIIETHATTEEAGRMAAEAGVKTMVLNHVLPGALMALPDEAYFEGVRQHFQGEVIVGTDGMVI